MNIVLFGYIVILLLAVLIIIVTCGLFIPLVRIFRKLKFYERVDGRVIDVTRRLNSEPGDSMHYKYEYDYNGIKYIAEDRNYIIERMKHQLNVDDVIPIYVDPNNPQVYLPPNFVRHRYKLMFYVVWLLVMLIPIFIWIIVSSI